ncbi:hypothetical protein Y032_0380g337 [Ancylostoma ceylanicum]|uniref:Uncharacterized protein n=1 Tax=Ancylostoma ceylanicum TaxID=53326 RepID=A0A016RTA6_9BILA|nr:hypothetical protein Y032_0380g337 [Ancylostoma ceylanicum]
MMQSDVVAFTKTVANPMEHLKSMLRKRKHLKTFQCRHRRRITHLVLLLHNVGRETPQYILADCFQIDQSPCISALKDF